MRHKNKIKQLSRKPSHRRALLRTQSIQLIMHKRIITTLAKAKALRRHVEPILTRAKKEFDPNLTREQRMHNRRMVFRRLQNKEAVKELFAEIAPRIKDRPGGYTRVLKLGPRKGDGAEMALIELVDFNPYLQGEKLANVSTTTKPKKRRRRRKKKKSGENVDLKDKGGTNQTQEEKKEDKSGE